MEKKLYMTLLTIMKIARKSTW